MVSESGYQSMQKKTILEVAVELFFYEVYGYGNERTGGSG